eukprot:6192621-Pleurochrysis_carterae.AAC.2
MPARSATRDSSWRQGNMDYPTIKSLLMRIPIAAFAIPMSTFDSVQLSPHPNRRHQLGTVRLRCFTL